MRKYPDCDIHDDAKKDTFLRQWGDLVSHLTSAQLKTLQDDFCPTSKDLTGENRKRFRKYLDEQNRLAPAIKRQEEAKRLAELEQAELEQEQIQIINAIDGSFRIELEQTFPEFKTWSHERQNEFLQKYRDAFRALLPELHGTLMSCEDLLDFEEHLEGVKISLEIVQDEKEDHQEAHQEKEGQEDQHKL